MSSGVAAEYCEEWRTHLTVDYALYPGGDDGQSGPFSPSPTRLNAPQDPLTATRSRAWDRPEGEPAFAFEQICTRRALEGAMAGRSVEDMEPPVERHDD